MSFSGAWVAAQCNDCATGVIGAWPTAQAGRGGLFAAHHQRQDEIRAQSRKIEARNQAWMQPFNCQDRQAFNQIWGTFVQAGSAAHCTLCDVHFHPDTADLNTLGKQKIVEILTNSSYDAQQIQVINGRDSRLNSERIASVKSSVSDWFGAERAALVVAADVGPVRFNGQRVQTINTAYNTQTPRLDLSAAAAGSNASAAGGAGGASGQ
jgi:hypothetical protein